MTRNKVKLAYITNDSARKATFKKRKKGLLKKMDELTTLCGVDGCAIIYSPYDEKPAVWPNTPEARHILSKFKKLPEMEQYKKMMTQEEFLTQRVAKAHDQLNKLQRQNREKEMTDVMYQCLTNSTHLENMNLIDLSDLRYVIDENLNVIKMRLNILRSKDNQDANLVQQQPEGSNMVMSHVYATHRQPNFTNMLMSNNPNYDCHTSDFGMMAPPMGCHDQKPVIHMILCNEISDTENAASK
ncbi:agamous-like MADS-box protein AGL80 [Silene latifolia]|uniref:agamous-like MADS-box protein AGL80 n=1 Tax=Silene latifolia TaxID=37657 RepID=UPI003D7881B1